MELIGSARFDHEAEHSRLLIWIKGLDDAGRNRRSHAAAGSSVHRTDRAGDRVRWRRLPPCADVRCDAATIVNARLVGAGDGVGSAPSTVAAASGFAASESAWPA